MAPARGAEADGAREADGVPRDHPGRHPARHRREPRRRLRPRRRPGEPPHRRPPLRLPRLRGVLAQDPPGPERGAGPVAQRPPRRRARARAHGLRGGQLLGPAARPSPPSPPSPPRWPPSTGTAWRAAATSTPRAGPSATTSPCSTRWAHSGSRTASSTGPSRSRASTRSRTPRGPKPPFITSTLQQVGGSRLRMSSRQVMSIAQGLYEDGYITYMRTDSTTLSDTAIRAARQVIERQFGREYLTDGPAHLRQEEQERPGGPRGHPPRGRLVAQPRPAARELRGDQLRLYELIWQRTLASQMPDARGNTVTVRIAATHHRRRRHRVDRVRPHDHLPRLAGGLRVQRRRRRRGRG